MAIAIDRLEQKPPVPESELIAQAKAGDKDAAGALWFNYRPLFMSTACRMGLEHESAEDFAQGMAEKMPGIINSYDPEKGKFGAIVSRSAHNAGIDELRRRRARPVLFDPLPGQDDTENKTFLDQEADPQRLALQRERRRLARMAVAVLPIAQRQAVELVMDGYSQREIAERTGEPLGTAKTRIRLGQQKVRAWLVENAPDYFGDEQADPDQQPVPAVDLKDTFSRKVAPFAQPGEKPEETFARIVKESTTRTEAMRKLGITSGSTFYRYLGRTGIKGGFV